jgi:c-di-GMP-binding flagellar brake protein YcgR
VPTERRCWNRVTPSRTQPVIITRLSGHRELDDVEIKNISEQGICISFNFNAQNLYLRESLDIEMDLGSAGLVRIAGAPRFIQRAQSGKYDLGLVFMNMPEEARRALKQYVDARLREEARKPGEDTD